MQTGARLLGTCCSSPSASHRDAVAVTSNPLVAQALSALDQIEQRGSGGARMRDAMLNHGLKEPQIGE